MSKNSWPKKLGLQKNSWPFFTPKLNASEIFEASAKKWCIGVFWGFRKKNLLSLVFFKTDLCSNGVKSQKCEKTIARSAQYFKQFISKYLVIQCIKPRGFKKNLKAFWKKNSRLFGKKNSRISQKTQCFGGYQPQSASKKMFKKLAWVNVYVTTVIWQ